MEAGRTGEPRKTEVFVLEGGAGIRKRQEQLKVPEDFCLIYPIENKFLLISSLVTQISCLPQTGYKAQYLPARTYLALQKAPSTSFLASLLTQVTTLPISIIINSFVPIFKLSLHGVWQFMSTSTGHLLCVKHTANTTIASISKGTSFDPSNNLVKSICSPFNWRTNQVQQG